MNAAKRFLTGAAVAAGALGIGAGVFFACRQELSPGGQSGADGAERKAAAARFNDGDYTFYFKNGREASGDCDGYSSDFGGKTTIYEWWRDDIRKWETRVKAAGANTETNSNKYHSGYYWVSFDTSLIYGTGLHVQVRHSDLGDAYLRMNGKETKVSSVIDLKYARAGGDFGWESKRIKGYGRQSVSEAQKNRDAPGLGLVFYDNGNKTASALRGAGYSVENIYDDTAFLADAGAVDWFAFDNDR
ncbi:hypothetical protein [Treponema endosymbiont of Eucomonympha sp.]|uniref:hypothetical protein n=1 Tax=Treponema endosymbiont of Eucomonympha sp. TaxID=1580831 RepID=UPI00075184B8|nr:hypothetical protein [Treponema endosymbiont of Eucomonympha sp.]